MNTTLRRDADEIICSSIQAVLPDKAVCRALEDFQPGGGRVLLVAAVRASAVTAPFSASLTSAHAVSLAVVSSFTSARPMYAGICSGSRPIASVKDATASV